MRNQKPMEIQGTHQFSAPLDQVWSALLDPAVLSRALPGAEQLVRAGENDYRAAMQVKVGPVQGRFEGKVELSDITPRTGYRLRVSGQGTPGFVNGEGTLRLEANGEGTLLHYAGDVQIGGRIAGVGQRLLDSAARSLIRQGLQALDDQLGPQPVPVAAPAASIPAPAAPATAIPPAAAPATGRMAAAVVRDIAQDLAAEYIPREKQQPVFYFVLGAVAMLLFVVLVRTVQRD
jgi:carbon monoxide dehydrogenase subunit G